MNKYQLIYEDGHSQRLRDVWRADLSNCQVLAKMPEGYIYRYQDLVIKVRAGQHGPKKCVRREYRVGKLVDQLGSQHLVKTLGYAETNSQSLLVVQYVEGLTLRKFAKRFRGHCQGPLLRVLAHLCLIIFELQERAHFTHYGLHAMNIMIREVTQRTFSYHIQGQTHQHTSCYCPVIIDLGRTHIRGIGESYYEEEMPTDQVTPGVYDQHIDMAWLLESLKSNLYTDYRELYEPFERVGLLKRGYRNSCLIKLPKQLHANQSFWAPLEPSHYNLREWYEKFQRTSQASHLSSQQINHYNRGIARAVLKEKLEMMAHRPSSRRLFSELWKTLGDFNL